MNRYRVKLHTIPASTVLIIHAPDVDTAIRIAKYENGIVGPCGSEVQRLEPKEKA